MVWEIHRNPAMHGFFREHFRMSFDSFQALCRIVSYSEAYAGVFAAPDYISQADRDD